MKAAALRVEKRGRILCDPAVFFTRPSFFFFSFFFFLYTIYHPHYLRFKIRKGLEKEIPVGFEVVRGFRKWFGNEESWPCPTYRRAAVVQQFQL